MNITITRSHLERTRNAVGQAAEAVADLVESEAAPVIGVFPAELPGEPWRAHHLAGAVVEAGDDDVVVFRFANSTESFCVKQELRRREEERKREAAEREKAKRSARA